MRDGIRKLRVAHIADLMSCFAWDKQAFEQCLSEWDISRPYLAELARQAGTAISIQINDPGYVSAMVAQSLKRVLDKAEEQGDWKSVVAAALAWQKIAGPRSSDPALAESEVPEDDPELTSGDR